MTSKADEELRDLVIYDDGGDEPIRVRDIECAEVPLDRIRAVVDRLGADALATGVLAQTIQMGMLAPMMAYIETGDETLIGEAVDIRLSLAVLDALRDEEDGSP